jgi:hypothetical protein
MVIADFGGAAPSLRRSGRRRPGRKEIAFPPAATVILRRRGQAPSIHGEDKDEEMQMKAFDSTVPTGVEA